MQIKCLFECFFKEDLETQLLSLDFQKNSIRRELESNQLLFGDRTEQLSKLTKTFPEQVKAGLEGINDQPKTLENAEQQLGFRKKIVQSLLIRVEIDNNKGGAIDAVFDLSEVWQFSMLATNCQTL